MTNVSVKVKHRKSVVKRKATPLYLQLIYKRKPKRIPLDFRLYENEWDAELEVVHIPLGTSRERSEYLLQVTVELEKILAVMHSVICWQQKRLAFTVEDLVARYIEQSSSISWNDYLDKQVTILFSEKRDATAHHYRSLGKSFNNFLQGQDVTLKAINEELVKKYETWLVNRQLAPNTVSFYLRKMRTIWNKAMREGLIEQQTSPFRDVNTRIEETEKRAVDTVVIRKLEKLNEVLSPDLAKARDLFLFCYYACGMAFVDLAHLTSDNIRGGMLIYKRKKTGQELRIKLLPVMLHIIARYRNADSPYLFPVLKTENAGYQEYQAALRLQNLRLEKIGKMIGVKLSTYVPRHSWASVAKNKGVSDELISESMGHTSLKTTKIYIKTFDNSRLDHVNEYVITGKRRTAGTYKNYMI